MIYIENNSNNPYFNLAFEEYCLGNLKSDDTYFLLWRNAPAVIFGKNQDVFQEVDFRYAKEHGIYLVRRITGGGAVYHDLGNLNISIMGNYELHPDYAQEYGSAVTEALRKIGLNGVVMNGRNDFYVEDRKISGWAKRIQGNSFLLHGTLLYDVDLDQLERVLQTQDSKMQRKAVKSVRSVVRNICDLVPFENLDGLRNALELEMRGTDEVIRLSENELKDIHGLVDGKYRTDQWIYNLSFTPSVSQGFKKACGYIVVNVLLEGESAFQSDSDVRTDGNKTIAAIEFKGDFLGNKDTEELCSLLKGAVWNEEGIRDVLSSAQVEEFFTGLSNEEFLAMLGSLMEKI